MKKLTIIMPVYNEEKRVMTAVARVLAEKINGVTKEVIIVNDGSKDKTGILIKNIKDKRCKIYTHKTNQGKGAAVKTAFSKMTGDLAVVQDADLEYDPCDLSALIKPILEDKADVVYGSRFVGSGPHRVLYFWHSVANGLVTTFCNMLTDHNFTDVETGYKVFTCDVIKKIDLQEKGFNFDPEITVKIAKLKCRIYEVGVSYAGRSYADGKKIKARDGFTAIWAIIKYAILKQ